MVGLSDSISLSFKQQFRRTAVNTLQDIADVVTQSAVCNEVEVVGWEDGVPLIPMVVLLHSKHEQDYRDKEVPAFYVRLDC